MTKVVEFKVPSKPARITVQDEYNLGDAGAYVPLPIKLRLLERLAMQHIDLESNQPDLLILADHLNHFLGEALIYTNVVSKVTVRTRSDLEWQYDVRIDLQHMDDSRRTVAIETALISTPPGSTYKRPEDELATRRDFLNRWVSITADEWLDERIFNRYGHRELGFGRAGNKFTIIRRASPQRSVITCFEFSSK
jgi:hypothetical protein